MKIQEILELIKRPEIMDENTSRQLRKLLEDYPYFQTAHLLYLMNLHSLKDSEFNDELKRTACYVGNRRNLYLLIHRDQFASLSINSERPQDLPLDSSFDLIDFFLAEKSTKDKKACALPAEKSAGDFSSLVSADYIASVFSGDVNENELDVAPKMQHQATIDEFLRRDAESPVKIALKDPEENAVQDTISDLDQVDGSDFFSETLAKIYIKQKKYERAIEIIKKLHLVYPEKNIYFADQIRFLEKLIINIQKK